MGKVAGRSGQSALHHRVTFLHTSPPVLHQPGSPVDCVRHLPQPAPPPAHDVHRVRGHLAVRLPRLVGRVVCSLRNLNTHLKRRLPVLCAHLLNEIFMEFLRLVLVPPSLLNLGKEQVRVYERYTYIEVYKVGRGRNLVRHAFLCSICLCERWCCR